MSDFGGLGIFFVIALVFPVMALIPAFILQPRQPTREKGIPYECGVDTEGKTYVQFRAGYFMYALVFLVCDIETVFLLTNPSYSFVSSSGVRELAMFRGDVHGLVPSCVEHAVNERIAAENDKKR